MTNHLKLHSFLYRAQVSPTDGDNRGFLFPGISSVQNTDPTIQYGGVMYAYSTDKIRLWHPKLDSQHFLVYINNEWGRGNHVQSSESVVAKVSVWKAGQICTKSSITNLTMFCCIYAQ